MLVATSEQIDAVYDACYNHDSAVAHIGSNGYMFVTIAPSGSKDGWATQKRHGEQTDELLSQLKLIDEHLIVATATTSCG